MKKQNHNDSNSQTSVHYANVGTAYNQAFFYEDNSDYQRWQLGKVLHHLRLQPTDQAIDLGCGTGVFTSAIYTKAGLTKNILAVDPSQSMLNLAQNLPGMTIHCSEMESFVKERSIGYDKVLMKEVIHHISSPDLTELYRGIYRQLHQGGILLTVTRPAIVHYPFFQAALEQWVKQTQAHTADILAQYMEDTGFSVSSQTYYYPIQISTNKWLEMIRNRFWSTFSYFNDEELEAGINELTIKYAQTDVLKFEEALIFIEAVKN
ncbi:MAG: class I SAM-dependent methyltransferase [Cyanobacteriota bacterium]|nr:class I SAM-dependent methyltransferase [Cyanobacteriota bacterium]